MTVANKEALKRLKQLNQHLAKIRKKCKDNNVFLISGFDSLKDMTPEAQEGPMIQKLFVMVEDNKKFLKGKII